MKKWTFILCIVMLTASCNSILRSRPLGTLSENEMVSVLVDIHLTEATLRLANDSITRLNDTNDIRIRFAQVFKKHDIQPDDFNQSLTFYLEHIEELDKIYIEVINQLTVLDATLVEKTGKTGGNLMKKSKYGFRSKNFGNPWFRTLDKSTDTLEMLYFDTVKYPFTAEEKFFSPALVQ